MLRSFHVVVSLYRDFNITDIIPIHNTHGVLPLNRSQKLHDFSVDHSSGRIFFQGEFAHFKNMKTSGGKTGILRLFETRVPLGLILA